jgi:DNA-binding response OmpR family regulator
MDAAERRRFLVADDDPDARALVGAILRRDGAYVVEASDGLELLEWGEMLALASEGKLFDAIVSDIRMPNYSALDVLTKLPVLGRKTPVILMSAFNDEPTMGRAYALGAALVVGKPFHPGDMRALVRAVLRRWNAGAYE